MASTKKTPAKKRTKTSYPTSKIIASKKTFSLTTGQKRFALFGIIGLLVIAGLGYAGSRFFIDASTTNYNVWQWNVAGQKINKGSTTNGMTEEAAKSILNRNAGLVSLNELCDSQYQDIKSRLKKAKWPTADGFYAFVTTNPTGCGKDNAFGNAIFIRNGVKDIQRATLQSEGKKEVRAIVCGLAGNTRDRFCSTHITFESNVNGVDVRAEQLARVHTMLENFSNKGERVIIAGDFNAQPNYKVLNSWYASSLKTPSNANNKGVYREVDDTDTRCSGYGEDTTTDGKSDITCATTSKIDMIFFRENQVASYNGDSLAIANTCGAKKNQACSDHRILIGNIVLKTVPGEIPPYIK